MSGFYSECGNDFDEYVRRIVGPMAMGAMKRNVSNLWIGRRFKLHLDGWREGKVLEWCQWKTDPSLYLTEWSMTFELTTSLSEDQGADTTTTSTNDSSLTLRVNRMNIEGGGTLRTLNKEKISPLSSLEWIDSASPQVKLDEEVLSYKCPCCRAIEAVVAAHEQTNNMVTDECPICLEIKDCRVLGCGHCVCDCCWSSYRKAAANIDVQLVCPTAEELRDEPAKRDIHFRKKIASGEAKTVNHFAEIVEQVFSGEQKNLARFWKELMVVSAATFFYSDVKTVICQLPIDAIKVFLHVLEERKEELFAILDQDGMREFVSSVSFYCCDVLCEKYRQAGSNRCALPYSQLALFHARQSRSRTLLAAAHVFLGSTQQSVGMLSDASNTYDKSLGLGSSAGDVWRYREDLLREIEQWTGSSGKLTPGC